MTIVVTPAPAPVAVIVRVAKTPAVEVIDGRGADLVARRAVDVERMPETDRFEDAKLRAGDIANRGRSMRNRRGFMYGGACFIGGRR